MPFNGRARLITESHLFLKKNKTFPFTHRDGPAQKQSQSRSKVKQTVIALSTYVQNETILSVELSTDF